MRAYTPAFDFEALAEQSPRDFRACMEAYLSLAHKHHQAASVANPDALGYAADLSSAVFAAAAAAHAARRRRQLRVGCPVLITCS